MLQELEDGVMHFIVNKSTENQEAQTVFLRNWETRFQLVQACN